MNPCGHILWQTQDDSNSIIIRPKRDAQKDTWLPEQWSCERSLSLRLQEPCAEFPPQLVRLPWRPLSLPHAVFARRLHSTTKLNQYVVAKIQQIARQHVRRTLRITGLYSWTRIVEMCTSGSTACSHLLLRYRISIFYGTRSGWISVSRYQKHPISVSVL